VKLDISESLMNLFTRGSPLKQVFIDGIPLRSETFRALVTFSDGSLSSALSLDAISLNLEVLRAIVI
jgi:hypothetical protein